MEKMIFDLQRFGVEIYLDDYTISRGGEYYIDSNYTGKITVATTNAVTLEGSGSTNNEVQIVSSVGNMNLTIKDLNVTNDTDSVIKFGSGSGNAFMLDGTSNLTVNDGDNAAVNSGGGLTINGRGSLNASADRGAGVGGNCEETVGSIIIGGGNINATSVSGAGIGSGYGGSIRNLLIRFSANINARSYHGAGIGRGQEGSSGSISIQDEAQVIATTEGSDSGDVISALATSSGNISITPRDSTYTQNKVTINNAAETSMTINDTTYTGKTLTFYDGTPALEITAGGEYTINENNFLVTITTPEAVTLKGDGSALSDVQIVATTTAADLTIENLMISNSEGNVIKLANNRIHKLNIEGANILTTTDENAAAINIGGGLTIDGKGLLIASAKNGAGIGGDARSHVGRLTIDGGFIVAESEGGAGIGIGKKGNAGNISIGSGTIIFASAKVTEDFDWDNVPCGIATSDDKSITVSEEDTLLVVTNTNPYAAPKINGKFYEGLVITFQNDKYVSSITEAGTYDADDFSEDTVFVNAADQSVEIFMNANTKVSPLSGDIKLTNYDASTKSGVKMRTDDFVSMVQEDYISFAEDAISFGDVNISHDSELLNIYDSKNKKSKVGFAEGSKVDASTEKKSVVIFSNGNSTLMGGSGNDTIFAGANDIVDAGAGKNQIFLPEDNDSGTTIVLSQGKTTVENFGAKDVIDADIFSADVTFDGGDLIIRDGDGKILLNDVSEENFATVMFGENKVAVAKKNSVIEVTEDLPDIFIGKKSAIDFRNYDGEVSIDLDSEKFRGINKIIAGSGETTIKGSDANEFFVSGGATNFYLSGGRDTIENFSSTDKIFAEDEISKKTADLNGNVIIETANGSLQLNGMAGKNLEINSVITQIARKELIFDGEAEKFIAFGANATVEVAESSEGVEILLSDGNFEGDIKILDGSKNSGASKLYGNDYDNIIIASSGGSELWGGNGDDTLIGGDGDDNFIYTTGNDKVSGAGENDTIYLRGLTLDKIIGQEISDSSIKLNFDGGGSLSLDTNEGTTFNVDGANYVYNKESGKWDER